MIWLMKLMKNCSFKRKSLFLRQSCISQTHQNTNQRKMLKIVLSVYVPVPSVKNSYPPQ